MFINRVVMVMIQVDPTSWTESAESMRTMLKRFLDVCPIQIDSFLLQVMGIHSI